MPTKRQKQFTAWSYSRRQDYKTCPFYAKLKHLDKAPMPPPGPALERGRIIHDDAEKYATGETKRRPKSLDLFAEEFKVLRKIRRILKTELEIAFDKNWNRVDWFSPQAWCRIKTDLLFVDPKDDSRCVVVDYKTGKVRPENMEQVQLYTIGAFSEVPDTVERCDSELWYLDEGEAPGISFARQSVPRLKKYWEKETRKMLRDKSFAPTPGWFCRFCPFAKGKEHAQCRF